MNAAQRTALRLVRSEKANRIAAYQAMRLALLVQEEYAAIQSLLKDKCVETADTDSLTELVQSMARVNGTLRELVDLKNRMESQ